MFQGNRREKMSDSSFNKKLTRRQFLQGSAVVAAGSLLAAVPQVAAASAPAKPVNIVTSRARRAAAGGKVVVGTVGDLSNMDPFFMSFVNYPMMENVYDQFVRLDNQVKPSPAAIEEWTASADGLSLSLKVRQGVKYHGGGVATAEDVVACIKRATNADTGAHQYPSWQVVKEATAKGNDMVAVTFSKPAAYIIPAMGFLSLIQPDKFEGLKGQEGGSGAFKVKEWIPGDKLELEKFADYWDTGKPVVDSATINFFADDAAMVAALEAGTVDIALSVPPREYKRLQEKFNVIRGQDAANFYFLGFNTKKPPFDKKEVRQAIAHTIDRATMCQNVLFGVSDPIKGPWPKFSFAYFPEFDTMYDYDLEEAKKMLADAGYADGLEFTIPTANNFPELAQFAEVLKASCAQIGVTVNIETMDGPQWYPILIDGTYEAIFSFAGGTQWYPTRITLSNNFSISGNSVFPDGNPPKDWVDGISKADASFDPAEQKAGMYQAAKAFMEEMWCAPVAFRYTLFGLQKGVEGFGFGVYDQARLYNVSVTK
jgi:peptide/nickel transport system substrate-binding protein